MDRRIGGTLSQYKDVFAQHLPFLRTYPYLPACLVAASFPLLAAILASTVLKEVPIGPPSCRAG
jgi:hypothetical protein